MRGVSQLVGHALSIAIAVGVLTAIFVQVSAVKSETEARYAEVQAELVIERVAAESERLFALAKSSSYTPPSSHVAASLELSIPDKIGGRSYELLFEGKGIKIRASHPDGSVFEKSRMLSSGITYGGSARAPARIELERGTGGNRIYLVD